jgi:hypothetical protein
VTGFPEEPETPCIFRLWVIGDISPILPIIDALKKVWLKPGIPGWLIGGFSYLIIAKAKTLEIKS